MDIESRLRAHPLFASFTAEQLGEVVKAGNAVTYPPGEVCIEQGEAGEVFGVLLAGQLEAVRDGERVGVIQAGECFGEMSLLTGNPTGTSVVAVTAGEAFVFPQAAISPIIAINREAVRFLTRLITQRLAPPAEAPKPPVCQATQYSLGAAGPLRVLALSCRATDVRFSYFDTTCSTARAWGRVSGLDGSGAVHEFHADGEKPRTTTLTEATHEAAIKAVFESLLTPKGGMLSSPTALSAIGHRVCHGGVDYDAPAVVDEQVVQAVSRLADLAPLDNPYNLRGIEACRRLAPGVPQVAVFDTAFHLKMPAAGYLYALPRDLAHDPQLRRIGFHGISHEGASRAAAGFLGHPFDTLRMVTCHLGAGGSITAIDHGRPVDTSMGFTPLEGLVMATRPGDLDPGLLLHLIEKRGIAPGALMQRLFNEAGLLGLSGLSSDVVTLLEAADHGDAQALLALQVYVRRARKYLSAYIGLLGGADAIVFTGGVGQNAPGVRARILQGLECMGIVFDDTLNRSARAATGEVIDISPPASKARVLVVGADEETTIASKTVAALTGRQVTGVMRRTPRPIPIGISVHHLHLTQPHVEALFGKGHQLTWLADLTQPGQFACVETVNLVGPKGRIEEVRVLGPVRSQSQVEIARTEEFKLGIDAPIRLSGDLDGTPGILLEGPGTSLTLERGVICAHRHIHMAPEDAMAFAVRDHDEVRVRVAGERSLIFGDVIVRVDPNYRLEMHIDTDEANAAELSRDAVGTLDSVQERAAP